MKTFRSYQLSVKLYHSNSALRLPRHLKDQLQRAASSIALNLAEGSGRRTEKDKRNFFYIALGSLRECQAILDLVPEQHSSLKEDADKLGAHIYKFIKSLD